MHASVNVMATIQSSGMPILKEKVTHKLEKLARCHAEHVHTHKHCPEQVYHEVQCKSARFLQFTQPPLERLALDNKASR